MNKYRIIQEVGCKTFKVQELTSTWFGKKKWITIQDGSCDDIGVYEWDRLFKSIEDAEKYIEEIKNSFKCPVVIKYL